MISQEMIDKAIAIGKGQAKAAIEFRNAELARRAQLISQPSDKPHERLAPELSLSLDGLTPELALSWESLLGRPKDVLVAEGDSWFDYPLNDILRILEDHHGYDVESVAHKGDRIEEMAYGDGQLEALLRRIEKVKSRGSVPKAILLSGGGNDIAGEELGMLINHSASAISGLSEKILEGVIDERLKLAYITLLSTVTSACERRIGKAIPILIHGYDYPIPDGRGFMGGWAFLPGPWLEPGFREKGFTQLHDRASLTKQLMDRFNEMLQTVASMPQFAHVHYINLRKTLSAGDNYKEDWANELHPTEKGFVRITQKFVDVIKKLP